MRQKLSFLSGLAVVILVLNVFAIHTFAASNATEGTVSANVYSSDVTDDIYNTDVTDDVYDTDVTDDVYDTDVTGDVYGTDVTGDVYGTDVTGDVYGTDVTGDVYGNDVTPPAAPKVNHVSDHSTVVVGKAEAGSTVTVTIGHKKYHTVADTKGNYKVKIAKQKSGTTIKITVTDKAENVSKVTTIKVYKLDTKAPSAPKVYSASSKSTVISGKAEARSSVTVKIGKKTYKAVADSKGNYKVKISKQKAGTRIKVTATDKAGNVSKTTTVTVHKR